MASGGFEAHITVDRQFAADLRRIADQKQAEWVFSEIAGCPLLGAGTYAYLTGYDRDVQTLKQRLDRVVDLLQYAIGVPVLRAKIEHIVYDTKTGVNELQKGGPHDALVRCANGQTEVSQG